MHGFKYHVAWKHGDFELADNGTELDEILGERADLVEAITLVPDDITHNEAALLAFRNRRNRKD